MIQSTHSTPPDWCGIEYPSKRIRNCDSTLFAVIARDHYRILNADGTLFSDLVTLGASQELAWHPSTAQAIYCILGNQLRRTDVALNLSAVVWTFDEYSRITGRGKSDISEDGSHFVFEGTRTPGNVITEVFVYDCVKNIKGPTWQSTGRGVNNIYLTPDNNVAISYFAKGNARYTGVELFNSSMVFQRQLVNANGHLAFCRDADGSEIMLWTNSDENPVTLEDFPNGIVKVRLSDAKQTGLLALGWAPDGPASMAVDIAADSKLGCLVTTYGRDSMVPFANEIIMVPLDPKQKPRLICKHNSNVNLGSGIDTYQAQPRAAFVSDNAIALGSNNGQIADPNYCDVWIARLDNAPTLQPDQVVPSTGLKPVKFPPNKDYWIHIQTDKDGNPTVEEFEN